MSTLNLGIRYPGGTKRIKAAASSSLKQLKEQIGKEIGQFTASMKLFGPSRKEFVGDSNSLSALGINDQDLVIVDVPLPTSTSTPSSTPSAQTSNVSQAPSTSIASVEATAPVVKTCPCKGTQRCLRCMSQPTIATGYNDTSAPAISADPTDYRTTNCRHGKGMRCVNCRPLASAPSTSTTPDGVKFGCQHGPGRKCVNCLSIDKSEIEAEKKRVAEFVQTQTAQPVRCQHPPGGKCLNCIGTDDSIDRYDPDYDPRKHCRHHGPFGSCTECLAVMDALQPVISSQTSSLTKRVDVAKGAARAFGQFSLDIGFSLKRAGILYGTATEDGVVKVEAIYEPPQTNTPDKVTLSADRDAARIDELAKVFGWNRVGWVFSHGVREIHMETGEILQAAAFQKELGPYTVTLVCLPEGGSSFRFEAYQVSDQAVNMTTKGWFSLTQPRKDQIDLTPGRAVKLLGREVNAVPTLYFVCNVPIIMHDTTIRHDFPIANRPGRDVTLQDYMTYMQKNRTKSFTDRMTDFHLILFLSNLLSPEDAAGLAQAVKTNNTSRAEGYKYVINDLLGLSD